MTVRQILEECGFSLLAGAGALDRQADRVFCCDLLSFVMGRAPADSAWVTVMGNVNAIAVAVLADTACIVLAEGAALDEEARSRADGQGVPVLGSAQPIFDTGLLIQRLLED
ncbi:MAG: DRTGG domain-containing protein [Oscillospiraceae bacterium]|nr:DRTGG domain-containing protein [Oscillospiraceae bacterium]